MITLKRTNSTDTDFLSLVQLLDAELLDIYGSEMDFYNEFNTVEEIKHVIVAYYDQTPAGCGAIKKYGANVMEVKRVFVSPDNRGQGIAETVMLALETWAKELNYTEIILETGNEQLAAIHLYKKLGYRQTENYGQYIGAPTSVCFNKII